MDYRKFLSQTETLVLPYFGGTRVDAKDRRFRVEGEVDPERRSEPGALPFGLGWWRFKIDGRRATPVESASPIDLGSLSLVRGHWANGWLVVDGRTLHHIALPPDDEPPALSRVTARRWYSQDLVFDTTEFEDDAEVAARLALEQRASIGDVRGVTPSLRAAFGYALGMTVARELGIEVSLRELTRCAVAIADGGADVARQLFQALETEREREREEARCRAEEIVVEFRRRNAAATAVPRERTRDPVRRADEVLDSAGARILTCRRINRNTQLDVTYEVDGERIMSIIDIETFQVIDPGICLSGAHRVLTLDAMPSVVREAIEVDHLNITRHA